jgi:hypothetical protein
VEAGVDLDFPVVFRALGPLDAVAQAAGRCNRNGKARQGTVYVFLPEDEAYPDKDYRRATSVTRSLLQRSHSGDLDIHSPDTFDQYYRELYNLSDPQNANQDLLNAIKTLHFPEVARRYRVIAKDSINVVVHYRPEQTCQLEEEVRTTGLTRRWIARARPHAIGLFRPRLDAPLASRLIPIPFDADFLTSEWYVYSEVSHYDPNTGLVMPDSPECFIA